jgi:5'-3' exonuclease
LAFELPEIGSAPRVPNRIGLIDADVVAYWAAAGCDEMPVQSATAKVRDRMVTICDQIQTDEIRCYLTGKKNFREKVARYQMYKGNRYDKDGNRIKPQPRHLGACRNYIADNYNTTVAHGQEADDLLGIAQVKCNASKDWHSIISTIDKDLRIIPGKHHDMNSGYIFEFTDPLGALEIDAKGKVRGYGLKFFYAQLLMGDSADWIPGNPQVTQYMKDGYDGITRLGGCGPKAAYAVVADAKSEQELVQRVLGCYASYWNGQRFYEDWRTGERIYPTPEEALTEQGQLLWIRQQEDEFWQIPNLSE